MTEKITLKTKRPKRTKKLTKRKYNKRNKQNPEKKVSVVDKLVKKAKNKSSRAIPTANKKPNRKINVSTEALQETTDKLDELLEEHRNTKYGPNVDMTRARNSSPPSSRGIVVYTDGSSSEDFAGGSGWHGYVYDNVEVPPSQRDIPRAHVVTPDGYAMRREKGCCSKPVKYFDGATGYIGRTTNNKAELGAVLSFLEAFDYVDFEGATSILILSDSSYVVKGHEEWMHGWESKSWKTGQGQVLQDIKNKRQWIELYAMSERIKESGITVKLQWIKGHSNSLGNSRADYLALVGRRMSEQAAFSDGETTKLRTVWQEYLPRDYWSKDSNRGVIPELADAHKDGAIYGLQDETMYNSSNEVSYLTSAYYPKNYLDTRIVSDAIDIVQSFDEKLGVISHNVCLGFPSRDIALFGRCALGRYKKNKDVIIHGNDDTIVISDSNSNSHPCYGDRPGYKDVQESYEIFTMLSNGIKVDDCAIVDVTEDVYTLSGSRNHKTKITSVINRTIEFDNECGKQIRDIAMVPGVNLPDLDTIMSLESDRPSVYSIYFSDNVVSFAVVTKEGVIITSCDTSIVM